jgi:hypothetical protein
MRTERRLYGGGHDLIESDHVVTRNACCSESSSHPPSMSPTATSSVHLASGFDFSNQRR